MSALVAAIDTLTEVINTAVVNSRIIATLDEQISNALGLLVDLILLPFLPLLVGGIVQLYMAIIDFGKLWKDATKILDEEGLLGLIKVGVEAGLNGVAEWLQNILKFLFGTDAERSSLAPELIKPVIDFVSTFTWKPLQAVLDLLFGHGNPPNISDIAFNTVLGVISSLEWLTKAVAFIFGESSKINNDAVDFAINAVKGSGEKLWNLVEHIFNIADRSFKDTTNFAVRLLKSDASDVLWKVVDFIFKLSDTAVRDTIHVGVTLSKNNPADAAWKALESVSSGIGGFIGNIGYEASKMLNFDEGGVVPGPVGSPTMAIVHGGETVIPVGGSNTTNNLSSSTNNSNRSVTMNFYGLTDSQLPEKIRSVLRQEGARYNL